MAQINLLPWRERLREERRREFLTTMVGFVIIAGGLVLLVDRYFNGEIDAQTARNDFLRGQISTLDAQVAEINQLRQQKEDIRARMNVITGLQGTRPVIVRVFDELVRALPEGVYFESLDRREATISIEGVAESYSRITDLMRRIDGSEWFTEADISDISASDTQNGMMANAFRFTLSLTLELPGQPEEEEF